MYATRPLRMLMVLSFCAGFAGAAVAGPPLICQPFTVDAAAPQLPWIESRRWRSPHPDYDVARLKADTLALLSPAAPILGRVETLRRATIYAGEDSAVAAELLAAVLARTKTLPADRRAAALAWFDAGYLIETYRQFALVYEHGMLPGTSRPGPLLSTELAGLDGHVLVRKALVHAPELGTEIQFAASLMARE